MRKYTRLSLFITAFICFMLMVIYRQKYSNLNLVFQMMNAFGIKDADTKCNRKMQELVKHAKTDWHTSESSSGLPAWTEVFPDIYVYSAFWMDHKVRAIAFVKNTPNINIEKLKCKLWYEQQQKTPTHGNAKIQLLQRKKGTLLLLVECVLPLDIQKKPFGVSYVYSNMSSLVTMPVIGKTSHVGAYSVCVKPLPSGFSDMYRIIEFLVFHHYIGISHFIFYDQGFSPIVRKLLLEVAPKSGIFITVLPWNIPFVLKNSSSRKEYFIDCVYRIISRGYSDFMVSLDINQFLILKMNNNNISTLIKADTPESDIPSFYVQNFCLEYVDDFIGHNLNIPFISLLKTKKLANFNSVSSLIYNVSHLQKAVVGDFKNWLTKDVKKSVILPQYLAAIYKYKSCNVSTEVLEKYIDDRYMWKYKDLFFSSDLLKSADEWKVIVR